MNESGKDKAEELAEANSCTVSPVPPSSAFTDVNIVMPEWHIAYWDLAIPITPQATRGPAAPEGWEVKSSSPP